MQESPRKIPTSRLVLIGVGLTIVIIAATVLLGQRRSAGTERAQRYVRSDLQGLVAAMETTRRLTGKYLADPAAAGHLSTPGVAAPKITLAGDGYSAIVTHAQQPELRCAVAFGTRNPLSRFADDGEIVCE